jgi:hypothetical protein
VKGREWKRAEGRNKKANGRSKMKFDFWQTEREKAVVVETGQKVLTEERDGKYYLKMWQPKAKNPFARYYFKTENERTLFIKNKIESFKKHTALKILNKVNRPKSQSAQAASLIKSELKKAFPEIKFSVISKIFSMGNAVRIHWTNGVSVDEVEKITNKYQYGHFDGMTDMYENSNVIEGLPQAKFVTTSRTITDDVYMSALTLLKDKIPALKNKTSLDEYFTNEDDHIWGSNVYDCLYRLIQGLNLDKPIEWQAIHDRIYA